VKRQRRSETDRRPVQSYITTQRTYVIRCPHCGRSRQFRVAEIPPERPNPFAYDCPFCDAPSFVDLVGFTRLAAERDPEDVRALLDRYYERAQGVIDRCAGRIEKFAGDAVMALWGAPVSREDDAERAVAAALGALDAVVALGVELGAPSAA
jgi:hypothetical protein